MDATRRRDLLKNLRGALGDAAARARAERAPPQRRPPGAGAEADFLQACTRCGECSAACPEQAVFTFTESAGELAGTPVMLPEERACAMCDGFPCVAACADGALREPEPIESPLRWSLGTVRVARDRCLAYLGPECGACVGLCPRGLTGIRLQAWKPVVDAGACIGCGLCIAACPTRPAALELLPLEP